MTKITQRLFSQSRFKVNEKLYYKSLIFKGGQGILQIVYMCGFTKGEMLLMKKKGLITAGLVLVMSLVVCTTCFAGVTTSEQKILEALKEIELNGANVELPVKYYSQVENFLTEHDLTDEEVSAVLTKIDDLKVTLNETGATSIDEVKEALEDTTTVETVISAANAVANAAGVNLNITYEDGEVDYTLIDGDGNEIKPGGGIIKDTGFDATATVAVAAAGVALLGGCVAVARKNGLFAEEE